MICEPMHTASGIHIATTTLICTTTINNYWKSLCHFAFLLHLLCKALWIINSNRTTSSINLVTLEKKLQVNRCFNCSSHSASFLYCSNIHVQARKMQEVCLHNQPKKSSTIIACISYSCFTMNQCLHSSGERVGTERRTKGR